MSARTRRELYKKTGKKYFFVANSKFLIEQVKAERENSDTVTGLIIGGIIGLVAGPAGVVAGGTLGGLIGSSNESQEVRRVKVFNESVV